MPLSPGSVVGPYEVVALLGEGGMGQVYRARDRTLGREVALKILPDVFAADPDRLVRFEREARTLAALNHPNVAQVFDASGRSSSGQGPAFIAMELVAGEDLAARLARGPIPLPDVRDLARQIALALEAAHESAIVHRDLKPANIKVRDDGTLKVLDFGLAKALDPGEGSGAMASLMSPTITSPATALGTIIGTAAYMSPEQARGRAVDKRADIWAFGVVVFEMLTGGRLFGGETVSDTLAAVLRQDIPWHELPADTPPYLRRLLARCLERDSKRRLRDIGEARLALELGGDPAGDTGAGAPEHEPAVPRRSRVALSALPWLLLAGVVAVALWRGPAAPRPPAVLRAVLPHEDAGTVTGQIRLTSDGRHVVFTAGRDGVRRIVVRALDGLDLRTIPGTEGAAGIFLSPDDRWVAFFVEDRLKRVLLTGGSVEDLAEVPQQTFMSGTWTTRGEIVVTAPPRGFLHRLPEHGGTLTRIAPASSPDTGRGIWPLATPDGRFVLFQKGGPLGMEDDFLAVLSLETGEEHVTSIPSREPVAVLHGHALFKRPDGALMALGFDEASGRFIGEPFQVLESSTSVAVSAAGHAVYQVNDGRRTLMLRDGRRSEVFWEPPWPITSPRRSPRGDVIAFARTDEREVWVYDAMTGATTRLAVEARRPSWSADGTRVIYARLAPGMQPTREVFWRPVDGSAAETRLFHTDEFSIAQAQATPDGEHLLLNARGLVLVPLGGDRQEPIPIVQDETGVNNARISPDGRWVAYTSTDSGAPDVYLRPFPGPGGRLTVSAGGGRVPVWAPDGRSLYYRWGGNLVRATLEFSPAPRVTGRVAVVSDDDSQTGQEAYDVMPDGRLLVLEPVPGSIRMVVVANWIEEFRARLR